MLKVCQFSSSRMIGISHFFSLPPNDGWWQIKTFLSEKFAKTKM